MAGGKSTSLHKILNSLERGNKQDCIDFSRGHLNENNLLKYSQKIDGRSWPSAQKSQISLTPRSHLITKSTEAKNELPMHDALLKFSIGTGATIPAPPAVRKPSKSMSMSISDRRKFKPGRKVSYIDDGVLIEEFASCDPIDDMLLRERNEISPSISQDFGFTAITKRDQYLKRQILETDLIKKQDACEQNVLSGYKAVEHLELKLKHDLDQLDGAERGPSFHRLQVYGNVFENLISESTGVGPMLRTIKKEYDDYMNYLLDNNPAQHRLLEDQLHNMVERSVSSDLESERLKLVKLEEEADIALAENKRLRDEIDKEKRGEYTPAKSQVPKVEHRARSSPRIKDVSVKVQNLRTSILDHLDQIQKIRKEVRQDCVPAADVTQLEQCVKENEIENQILMKKNEMHENCIEELISKIAEEVQIADTSESDESRIWRKLLPRPLAPRLSKSASSRASVSSTRVVVTPSARTPSEYESESDEEDENKWNWYIS